MPAALRWATVAVPLPALALHELVGYRAPVQRRTVSSSAESVRAGWWWLLAGASVALILYGSLFPFQVRRSADLDLFNLIGTLTFKRTTRGDIVANLLLYMPARAVPDVRMERATDPLASRANDSRRHGAVLGR